MALLIDDLQLCIPGAWLLSNLTIYADDIHVHCVFHNIHALTQTVKYFEEIIAAIERLGLQISPSKSCVITRGKGPGYEKWKKSHTYVDASKHHYLVLTHNNMKTPLKKKQLYLGVILSYDQFERQTVGFKLDGTTSKGCNHGCAENITFHLNFEWN